MSFLAKLRIGDGQLTPELRAALEAEGLVLLEEGMRGSIRYKRFKAPGRRHHGKITVERIGLGISEQRLVVYCRSGHAELIDSPFDSPHFGMVDVEVENDDRLSFRIDYDRGAAPDVSGEIMIRARTPNAARIAQEIRARLGR